jgi:5-methylcytosine-specific restriction protein B
MNTTDRSLAQIDYALRRRFYFYHLVPVVAGRAQVLQSWLAGQGIDEDQGNKLLRLFITLNEKIQRYLGENFQVGHSYFMLDDIHQEETLRRVWRRAILPLLEEYFHNSRDREKLISEFSLDNVMHELDLSSPPIEEV